MKKVFFLGSYYTNALLCMLMHNMDFYSFPCSGVSAAVQPPLFSCLSGFLSSNILWVYCKMAKFEIKM